MELKEKSGVIELYHHTSSQYFMEKIMKERIINNDIEREDSICLSNDIFNSAAHSEEAVEKGNKDKLNLHVTLVIKIQPDNLIPHYDLVKELDGEINKDLSIPLWKQSLNETEECLSNKPISLDSIEKIIFTNIEVATLDKDINNKFDDYDKFEEFLRKYIDDELPVKEAYEGLLKAQEAYDKI